MSNRRRHAVNSKSWLYYALAAGSDLRFNTEHDNGLYAKTRLKTTVLVGFG